MFCFQCQEAAKNTGCDVKGVCGKKPETAGYQDLLIYTLKGLAAQALATGQRNTINDTGYFAARGLFATITNANFDDDRIIALIREALNRRTRLADTLARTTGSSSATSAAPGDAATATPDVTDTTGTTAFSPLPAAGLLQHDAVTWAADPADWLNKSRSIGVLSEPDQDLRSLKELIIYGLKGIAAYADHAAVLGHSDERIWEFILEALAATLQDKSLDELVALALKTGETAVTTMATLDAANTSAYGKPEITEVNIGTRDNPAILISGHDLKDMEQLLEQTTGTGVDVYTHSEMLPANYYPKFKQYEHFVGNYGGAWWQQDKEFASFNGPILMTTNCIVPVRPSYAERIYTTGMAGYPGVPHIEAVDGRKDFSAIIEQAKICPPPTQIETGSIIGGFAHDQVLALADKIVDAIKSGAIKRFVVMGGCDGRQKGRSYFTQVAETLPQDAVILTAGCAKYRYNKLNLGSIDGIPRVLDAGQCNDSYSLAVIALKLKEAFGFDDINELPISFDIAWYEQKAVAVLLALLSLGVKGIRLGPTLPAFLSPNVARVLVENFNIKPVGDVAEDVAAMMQGA
ncbi:hydroxylamine reductase [Spirochaeta africana]|nr:hydroxylamine reductase [Spirochaeta africana]